MTRYRRRRVVDPVGWWDGMLHDVEPLPNGFLLHFSTCRCRQPTADGGGMREFAGGGDATKFTEADDDR